MQSKQEALQAAKEPSNITAADTTSDKALEPIPGMEYMMHRYATPLSMLCLRL